MKHFTRFFLTMMLLLAAKTLAQIPDNAHPLRVGSDQSGHSLFRGEMAAVLNRFDMPVRLSLTEAFGKGVGVSRYRNLMENSRFALCPGGKDAESIRLFEALELGAIPVSLKHDFLTRPDAMDSAPIILLDSWEQWPQWYYGAISKPGYLDDMETRRQAIAAWWAGFKVEQADKVAKVINTGFAGR